MRGFEPEDVVEQSGGQILPRDLAPYYYPTDEEIEASPEYAEVKRILEVCEKRGETTLEQAQEEIDKLFLMGRKAVPCLELYGRRCPEAAEHIAVLIQGLTWTDQRLGCDQIVRTLLQPIPFSFQNATLITTLSFHGTPESVRSSAEK